MARLNEMPVAATDPMEIMKRKFLRQNKEIARVNANQAVRIRNLELEISRLLAENLELRSKIISQDHAPTRHQEFVDHVGDLKSQLDRKLREITNLVQTLDKPKRPRRQSVDYEMKAKARTAEERAQLMDHLQQQEGRLPLIPEHKALQFARPTMDQDEIARLRRSSDVYSDSPEIGPPPVSRLMDDTPAKISLPYMDDAEIEESSSFNPVFSRNLEQRRKRKDTSESRRGSGFGAIEDAKPEAPPLAKPGKRKFTVCDEQEEEREEKREARTVSVTPNEDFKFTRKGVQEKPPAVPILAVENEVEPIKKDTTVARKPKAASLDADGLAVPPLLTSRRALAPKMSNLDVANSPKKRSARVLSIDEEKSRVMKTKTPRDRATSARSRSRSVDPAVSQEDIAKTAEKPTEVEIEPETPAAADIFSAPSTAPSTRPLSRDTPPPGDIITTDGGEAARPSRRARVSVSYAEPNLRDKMRRPTKELAPAITTSARQSSEPNTTARVKAELEEGDSWKSKLPAASELYSTSPLSTKAAVLDLAPAQDITQRKGRRVSHHIDADDDRTGKSGSTIAITELMAAGKKSKQDIETDKVKKMLETRRKSIGEKDVYDFDSTLEIGAPPRKVRQMDSSSDLAGNKAASSTRRRQSAIATSTSSTSVGEKEKLLKRQSGLQRGSSSSLVPKAVEDGEGDDNKSERLGSRRRSMML